MLLALKFDNFLSIIKLRTGYWQVTCYLEQLTLRHRFASNSPLKNKSSAKGHALAIQSLIAAHNLIYDLNLTLFGKRHWKGSKIYRKIAAEFFDARDVAHTVGYGL